MSAVNLVTYYNVGQATKQLTVKLRKLKSWEHLRTNVMAREVELGLLQFDQAVL